MPLEASAEEFAALLKRVVASPTSDLTEILNISRPFITYWADNLKRRLPDVQIVSLLSLLSPDLETSCQMVDQWIDCIEETHTLEEELTEIFIETLRSMSFYPKLAKPHKVEYVVALGFKRRIKDLIKHCHPVVKYTDGLFVEEPCYPDYLLIKHLSEDQWFESLLFWLMRGYNVPTIAQFTRISEDIIRNDVRKLCQACSIDRKPLPEHEESKA